MMSQTGKIIYKTNILKSTIQVSSSSLNDKCDIGHGPNSITLAAKDDHECSNIRAENII